MKPVVAGLVALIKGLFGLAMWLILAIGVGGLLRYFTELNHTHCLLIGMIAGFAIMAFVEGAIEALPKTMKR